MPGAALEDRMRAHHVHGLSVAVVDGYRVVWAKAYGLADAEQRTPVKQTTLFQAGSISKPVAAAAILKRVEEGKLALDRPIDLALTSWKLPENQLTRKTPVTLAMLLSHTAGLTVHGFPGYAVGAPVPTVPQILDGVPPANTSPVRVAWAPGSKFEYSGAAAGDRDKAIAAYRDVLACASRDTTLGGGAKEALRGKALAKLKDLGATP